MLLQLLFSLILGKEDKLELTIRAAVLDSGWWGGRRESSSRAMADNGIHRWLILGRGVFLLGYLLFWVVPSCC